MIDLDQLEADEQEACIDKSDLFDFYNGNWSRLVEAVRAAALSAEDKEALAFALKVVAASESLFADRMSDPKVAAHVERCRASAALLVRLGAKP